MPLQPNHSRTAALRAVPMSLFPTMGSLQEAIELAESKMPITSRNELFSLLMIYHNSLLQELKKTVSQ